VIDTHAHLGEDAAEVLARARLAGVDRVVVVATTVADARAALALADAEEGVYASLGIHPHEAGSATAADVEQLRALLAHPKAVAVGETGLDHFRDYAPHDAQRLLFEAQLALAVETAKPVVIHTRAADAETLELLVAHAGDVVLHCFSSPGLLPEAAARGWYVSFAGNVTYKNAYELRASARAVPAERLLAETDSPYLAPQAVRGRRNEPAFVAHTYAALAEARGVEPAELAAQIDANADRVFRL
jgi:TatD DNase family protein